MRVVVGQWEKKCIKEKEDGVAFIQKSDHRKAGSHYCIYEWFFGFLPQCDGLN